MNKVRYRTPKHSSMSTLPCMYATRATVQAYNTIISNLSKRAERGKRLFLLHMANVLVENIRQADPEVRVSGGDNYKYAQDLRVAVLEDSPEESVLAVYLNGKTVKVDAVGAVRSVLYVRSISGSPPWVKVLEAFGPWPALQLPINLTGKEAKVISRIARPDEIKAFKKRILSRRGEIKKALKAAEAPEFDMDRSDNGLDVEVHQDIAHAVLRREFGLDGDRQFAHWRPALRDMMARVPDAMNRFGKYLQEGRPSVFNLPDDIETVSLKDLKAGDWFAGELAPFVPKS